MSDSENADANDFQKLIKIDEMQKNDEKVETDYKKMNIEKKIIKIKTFEEKKGTEHSELTAPVLRKLLIKQPEWTGKSIELKKMKKAELLIALNGEPEKKVSIQAKGKAKGVYNLLMLSAFGVEKTTKYFDIDIDGFKDDILKEKKTLIPICELVADEYCQEIDAYVSPLSQLCGALSMMAISRYVENKKKNTQQQSVIVK